MAAARIVELAHFPLARQEHQPSLQFHFFYSLSVGGSKLRRGSAWRPRPTSERFQSCRCSNEPSAPTEWDSISPDGGNSARRRWLLSSAFVAAAGLGLSDIADAVSTSRRALRGAKIPETDYKTLPNGLKYYDLKVGGGAEAVKGSRVATG